MKKKILFGGIWVTLVICLFLVVKGTYSLNSEYTREEMQDIVVSTALSYYYNNMYSDYGQTTMDDKSTFLWRTFNQCPEMISRVNNYYIDCSSFVASVYIHSLGYDFSEYYKLSTTTYFDDFTTYSIKKGTDESRMLKAYTRYGKGLSTKYYAAIGEEVSGYDAGEEYINDATDNTDIVAYYYRVSGSETSTEKKNIKNNILEILEPGDVVVYRYINSSDSYKGHAMLYVGDALDSSKGFIHSTGTDYDFDSSPISFGDDDYSVKYDGMKKLTDNIFVSSSSRSSYEFVVLRPINKYCSGNSCEIKVCSSDDCGIGEMNANAEARVDLSKLRVEQYTQISKSYNDNLTSDTGVKKVEKELSQYNSVNKGDNITYKLYLKNESDIQFCSSGNYGNESDCESAGYEWKTSDNGLQTYENLKIIGYIPDNTKYVGCNKDCVYDSSTNTVTWNVSSLSTAANLTYYYKVKVINDVDIENEGMEIETSSGNVLKLSSITTKVNPTINGINIDLLKVKVNKFKELYNDGKITFDSSTSSTHTQLFEDVTSVGVSQPGFVRMVYYNALGIDLGYLKSTNIKNALFDNSDYDSDGDLDYAKKTDGEVSALTNTNYININKMLVKGMYGGRYLRGNETGDRLHYIQASDLEFGDIVISFSSNAENMDTYLYYGNDDSGYPILVIFSSSNGLKFYSGTSGYKILKELYSKDLFAIFRPTQLYGTTIKYNYNGATSIGDNSYVGYSIYRDLNEPEKDNSVITLNYNKDISGYPGTLEVVNTFGGWYSDSSFSNKVTNSTNLVSTSSHTLYAKWNTTTVTLPNPTVSDYKLEGWYSDSSFKNKVGTGGEKYTISKDITLYAKWIGEDEYSLSFDEDISINSGNNYIKSSKYGITVSEFLNKVTVSNGSVKLFNSSGNEKSNSDVIATGDKIITYVNNTKRDEYELSVSGDANGDGIVDLIDLVQIRKHVVGWVSPDTNEIYTKKGIYYLAVDMNDDSEVDLIDLVRMRKVIVGLI